MLELGVGMIAVCLPTLRPLLNDLSSEIVLRGIRFTLSVLSFGNTNRWLKGSATRSQQRSRRLNSESSLVGIVMDSNLSRQTGSSGMTSRAHRGEENWPDVERYGILDILVNREIVTSHQRA